MTHRTPRHLIAAVCSAAAAPLLGACANSGSAASPFRTERRISITSEPPGAAVRLNEREVGNTPLEADFTWFGTYDVVLTMPGYEPLITSAKASPRLHDYPGLDLAFGALPYPKRTLIEWHFDLTPHAQDADALIDRAQQLRDDFNTPEAPGEDETEAGGEAE